MPADTPEPIWLAGSPRADDYVWMRAYEQDYRRLVDSFVITEDVAPDPRPTATEVFWRTLNAR